MSLAYRKLRKALDKHQTDFDSSYLGAQANQSDREQGQAIEL